MSQAIENLGRTLDAVALANTSRGVRLPLICKSKIANGEKNQKNTKTGNKNWKRFK